MRSLLTIPSSTTPRNFTRHVGLPRAHQADRPSHVRDDLHDPGQGRRSGGDEPEHRGHRRLRARQGVS